MFDFKFSQNFTNQKLLKCTKKSNFKPLSRENVTQYITGN